MAYNPNFRGKNAKGSSRANTTGYQNGTLSGILDGKPVSVDASGLIAPTDVSSEVSVSGFVGLTNALIPSGASGLVTSSGRVESLTLAGLSVGDPVYVGKTGNLINTKPDIGVLGFIAGDWVIFVGVVVTNEFNPLAKDIQLLREIIGQL